jgi:hypothetical protein
LLTETALLGIVAFRAGKPLDYDAANMKFPSVPDADKLLQSTYRAGVSL